MGGTGGPSSGTPAQRTAARRGVPTLAAHLSQTHGIEVIELEQLDLGVYRVDRADGEPWVARLFPALRPRDHVEGDAEIPRRLAGLAYPAERVAVPEPVSVHEGQPVLVTEYVEPVAPAARREAIVAAGGLRAAVQALDTGEDLPAVFTHPDFVMANVVAPGDGTLVLVDWSGAGRAPRAWSLAFLLWSVGFGGDLARVDRAVDGYRRHIAPEPEELDRLDTLVASRPVVFAAWAFATGRRPLTDAARAIAGVSEPAAAIGARARAAFAGG